MVVLESLEQTSGTSQVHAGKGEQDDPEGLRGATEKTPCRAVEDKDDRGLVGGSDEVLDGEETLTPEDAQGGYRQIAAVVADPRYGREVGILQREDISKKERHERRMDIEVRVRPLHLPEESLKEGGEGKEGEDGTFDRAEH